MHKTCVILLACLAMAASAPRSRNFHFQYKAIGERRACGRQTRGPVGSGSSRRRLAEDRQSAHRFALSVQSTETGAQGNRILHVGIDNPKDTSFTVTMKFDAAREEHRQSRL